MEAAHRSVCSSLQAVLAVASPPELLRLGQRSRHGTAWKALAQLRCSGRCPWPRSPLAAARRSSAGRISGLRAVKWSTLAVRWECSRSWALAETEGHVLFT